MDPRQGCGRLNTEQHWRRSRTDIISVDKYTERNVSTHTIYQNFFDNSNKDKKHGQFLYCQKWLAVKKMLCQLTTMPTASSKSDDHVVNENIRLMDTRNPIMIPMTGRLADWRLDEQSTIFGGFIWRYPGETKYCLPKSPSLSALS